MKMRSFMAQKRNDKWENGRRKTEIGDQNIGSLSLVSRFPFPVSPSPGFTLLEVMIAMTILAMMSLLLYTSMSSTMSGKEDTEKKDNMNHSVALAFNKISNDLQMAFLLPGPDFLGTDGTRKTVFKGTEDKMDFASFSHVRYLKDAPEADFGEVGYSLEDNKDDEGGGKLLMRREAKVLDDKPDEGGTLEPLVEGVKEIHFSYFDTKKNDWLKSWDSSQLENSNQLPRAVKIEIKVQDPSSEEDVYSFSTIAEIRLNNGPINF
jgi:type II secretion system protein J